MNISKALAGGVCGVCVWLKEELPFFVVCLCSGGATSELATPPANVYMLCIRINPIEWVVWEFGRAPSNRLTFETSHSHDYVYVQHQNAMNR